MAALTAALLSAAPAAFAAQGRAASAFEQIAIASKEPVAIHTNPTTGRPYFVTAQVPVSSFSNAVSAAGRAADFWESYGAIFGVDDPSTELVLRAQERDRYGVTHLRYEQRYRGLAVHGQQLLLHIQYGQVIAVNGHFAAEIAISTNPTVSSTGAEWVADGAIPARGPKQSVGSPTLLVHVDGLGRARLAWSTRVATGNPIGVWRIFVDARNGDVLRFYNDLHTAKDRITHTNGSDPDCNIQVAPLCTLPGSVVRTEVGPPAGDPVVDDAHEYTGTVYDYYSTKFGRDSYNGGGHVMRSTVHFGNGFNNAFWCDDACATEYGSAVDGEQMVYGDGDGAVFSPLGRDLDVVAHELTHAVTGSEAALEYFGQSGALNESYSDVFAAMIDPDTNGNEWLIGEDSFTPGTPGDALRNMANPSGNDQPGHMIDYVNTTFDNGGVHTNSGIPNHAAYLAASDPNYGIGRDALEDIYYWALTACLNPSSDFLENLQCLSLGAQVVYPGDEEKAQAIRLSQADVGVAVPPAVTYPNGGETLPPGSSLNVTWNGGGPAGRPYSVSFFQSAPATYVEGFEAGPPLPGGFGSGGDVPWEVTAVTAGGGLKSARSGVIPDGQRSELHLVVSLRAESQITFKRLVSTEAGFDLFSFHIDSIPIFQSSGIGTWGTPSFFPIAVPAGTHELVWTYHKDSSGSVGLDAAFIDDLQIPNLESATATFINASTGPDATSEPWTPVNAGTTYRIRVFRHDTAPWLAFDESDGTFSVVAPPVPPQPPAPQPPAPQPPAPQPSAPQPPRPPAARCVVPNVKGKTIAQARRLLASKRCALGRVTRAYSAKVKRGKIVKQSRRPGVRLARGTRINVVVSRGRRR
jgi:thermolysin